MKSIVLIVLLAIAHKSMGEAKREIESSQLGDIRVYQQNGGKPIFISSVNKDEPEIVSEATDSDDSVIEERREEHSHHGDKVDCNCNKSKPRITYGPEHIVKGKPETYIHHQPKIIVRQPPTHVRIEHPPTIIHPSAIVFRRAGKLIKKPVIYQHLPQDVQVRPVVVKVVRPIEKKVIVENNHKSGPYTHHYQHDHNNGEYETESVNLGHHFKNHQHDRNSGEYETETVKLAHNCKAHQHDHNSGEYETESYGGENYSESFKESFNEHESLRGHLKIKETTPLY